MNTAKNNILLIITSCAFGCTLNSAQELGDLVFMDSFDRSESQEKIDDPGKGWETNSAHRAQGDKQVDLKDGAMYIKLSPLADHAVSVTHPFEFTNGSVSLRFLLENEEDSLGLNFADLRFKGVHAGHLFVARIYSKCIELTDLKTGNMRKDIREARKAKKLLTLEQNDAIKGKSIRFPQQTPIGKWNKVLITVRGKELSLTLNDKFVGSLKSAGIAHSTKRLLRLSVPKNVIVDDVQLWRK